MDKLTEWMTSRFQHPLSLPFLLLGVLLILLGLTTGFQLPVLQQLSIDPSYRTLAVVMGSVFILLSVFFTIAQEYSRGISEIARRIIEILAIIAGILGLVIGNLRLVNPILFYSALGLLLILSISMFISRHQANRLTGKSAIDNVWQQLLSGATQSIFIFAGDVSWISRDEQVIHTNVNAKGNKVRVLCRRPRNNQLLKENMVKLIKTGTEVKYYDESRSPVMRGLIIDGGSADIGAALTVTKSAKVGVVRKYGVPGTEDNYRYNARFYVPPEDIRQVQVLEQLFQTMWEQAMIGIVLEPKTFSDYELLSILSNVPQYNTVELSDIELKTVDIASMWASCTYVKEYKFPDILALLDAYETQDMPAFRPCTCVSHFQSSFLLPPIVEQHNDKLVTVDGMHRLFCRLAFTHKADALCLVVSPRKELPSQPIPFTDVKVWPRKMPRENSFISFEPGRFRNIGVLDRALVELYISESAKKRTSDSKNAA